MTFWNSPYNMNRLAILIFLKDQHTRTFGIICIFFHNQSIAYTGNDFSNENIVFSQFVISMVRYTNLALSCESLYLCKNGTHISILHVRSDADKAILKYLILHYFSPTSE